MITPNQIRGARSMLDWTQYRLAIAAGVSAQTIKNLEAGNDFKISTLKAIQSALEAAGVEFIDHGVKLREVA